MGKSEAYKNFIKQLYAEGRQKMDGYDLLTLKNAYADEKDELEDMIWKFFNEKNDSDLAVFLPQLKKYDGISALKAKLHFFEIPSHGSMNIAEVLYDVTKEKIYLDVMISNYTRSVPDYLRIPIVSRLSRLAGNGDVYKELINIYIDDANSTNRLSALTGILWADHYINDIDDLNEFSEKLTWLKKFLTDSAEERKNMMERYKNGDYDKYKR